MHLTEITLKLYLQAETKSELGWSDHASQQNVMHMGVGTAWRVPMMPAIWDKARAAATTAVHVCSHLAPKLGTDLPHR